MERIQKQTIIDLQKEEDNYLICEACGAQMIELGCKLKCKKCNYR